MTPTAPPFIPPDDNETLAEARARNVRDALAEDLGRGDWTARLVPAERRVRARVTAKEAAVICDQAWFNDCLHALDASALVNWQVPEGSAVNEATLLCEIEADARALLEHRFFCCDFLVFCEEDQCMTPA